MMYAKGSDDLVAVRHLYGDVSLHAVPFSAEVVEAVINASSPVPEDVSGFVDETFQINSPDYVSLRGSLQQYKTSDM